MINTATTIVTFLTVFLIQNKQNRDSRALHLKLDELILFTQGPGNKIVSFQELSDRQIDRLEARLQEWAKALGGGDIPDREPAQRPPRRSRGSPVAPPRGQGGAAGVRTR